MESHLCSLCLTRPAKSVCTCLPSLVRLCSQCLTSHSSSNPFQIHTLYPFSALAALSKPGLLSELHTRKEVSSKARDELWDNVKRLDYCRDDFQRRIDTMIEGMTMYREQTLSLLKQYREKLVETIKEAVEEANRHLLDEKGQTEWEIIGDLLEYQPGKLMLFQYEFTHDGKLRPKLRLPKLPPRSVPCPSEVFRQPDSLAQDSTPKPTHISSLSAIEIPSDLPKSQPSSEVQRSPSPKRTMPRPRNPFSDPIPSDGNLASLQPPKSPDSVEMLKLGPMQEGKEDTFQVQDATQMRLSANTWTPQVFKLAPNAGATLLQMNPLPLRSEVSLIGRKGISGYSAVTMLSFDSALICGGDDPLTAAAITLNFNSGEVQDLKGMLEARFAHGIAVYGACVYVFGGKGSSGALASAERYRRKGKAWDLLPPMQSPRAFINPCAVNKSIYLLGGTEDTSSEVFDIIGMRFSSLKIHLPLPGPTAALLIRDEIIILQSGKVTKTKANLHGPVQVSDITLKGRIPWGNACPLVVDSDIIISQCFEGQIMRVSSQDWTVQVYA